MYDPVTDYGDIDKLIDELGHKSLALMSSPRKWSSIIERVENTNIIDLEQDAYLDNLPAHRLILLMCLIYSLRHRAFDLHVEPWRYDKPQSEEADYQEGLGLRFLLCEADGRFRETPPPPNELRLPIAREIESAADFRRPRRQIADWLRELACHIDKQERPCRQGHFQLRIDEVRIDVNVLAWAIELGETYCLSFPSTSDQVSESAGRLIRRLFKCGEYGHCPDRR